MVRKAQKRKKEIFMVGEAQKKYSHGRGSTKPKKEILMVGEAQKQK
jgi:hypothetical protein